MRTAALVLFTSALVAAMPRADEVVRSDGRIALGTLSLEKTGKLLFTPSTGRESLSLKELAEVRFPAGVGPVFRGAPGHVLHVSGGEQISGVFLGLDKTNLLMRTAWADRLAVPRRAASALTHLPGLRPVLVDDFQDKLSAWSVTGKPALADGAVVLAKAGEALTHTLASHLTGGRISVNFRESGTMRDGRCLVEATFALKSGERVLRVGVAGEETLSVDTGGLEGTDQRVPRSASWRRLRIDFSPGSLRLTCDDDVLWYTLKQGPGGSLKQVRLVCISEKPAALRGSTAFSDFVIERSVSLGRRPSGDSEQDELWLAGGDQVFGDVVLADRLGVALKGRFGVRRYAWTGLRGWFLKRGIPAVPASTPGQPARVWLRSGLGPALDVLEGTLTSLNARQLLLHHSSLGELTIPRAYIARLRPLVEEGETR